MISTVLSLFSMDSEVAGASCSLSVLADDERKFLIQFDGGIIPANKPLLIRSLLSKVPSHHQWSEPQPFDIEDENAGIKKIILNHDGNVLALLMADETIQLWNIQMYGLYMQYGTIGEKQRAYAAKIRQVNDIVFTPDGQWLIIEEWNTATECAEYHFWKYGMAELFDDPHAPWFFSRIKPEGSLFSQLYLSNSVTGESYACLGDRIADIGKNIEVVFDQAEKAIKLYQNDRQFLYATLSDTGNQTCYFLASDRGPLVTGSRDKHVRLWDIASGRCVQLSTLANRNHFQGVTSLALSKDGQTLAAVSGQATINIWKQTALVRQLFILKELYGCNNRPDEDMGGVPSSMLFDTGLADLFADAHIQEYDKLQDVPKEDDSSSHNEAKRRRL